MMCPPCKEAADMDTRLGVPSLHDPLICRDRNLSGHGCTCQHGQRRSADPSGIPALILTTGVSATPATVKPPGLNGSAR